MSKNFSIGTILSVTTGSMVSEDGMNGVYEILNFMTGDNLFTHQLSRAANECKPYIFKQHPQLKNVSAFGVTANNFEKWLSSIQAEFGKELSISPLPDTVHEFIDPISEVAEKIHPNNIMVVKHD